MDINFMDFNQFFEENSKEVEINTPVGVYAVSEKTNLSNELKKRYSIFANIAVSQFTEALEKYEDCEDLVDNGEKDFQQSLVVALEDLKSAYVSVGEYDKDYDSIFQMAVDQELLAPFDDAYGEFLQRAGAIVDDFENEKNYREARKDNRSQWVGGTIGGNAISAVNTQMKIGAMNAASGAAHGLVNAAGNYLSEKEAENKLKNLFGSEKMRKAMIKGVYDSVMNLRFMLIKSAGGMEHFLIVTPEGEMKAQRLVNNLKSGVISEDKLETVFEDVLNSDPYNVEFYQYLFDKYGDDGSLSEFANYFGIDDLTTYKDDKALEYVKNNQGETEEDAQKAKELLLAYCEQIKLEVNDNLNSVGYIDGVITEFDRLYRTVDDLEHETRESADFSKEELPKIQEFMKDVKPLNGEPLLPYEKTLIAQKEKFEESFSSEVSKKYLKIIEKHIEDFEKSFLAVGFLGESTREAAAKKRALKYAKGLKYSTVEEFDKQYETFCSFIQENLGVTIEEATEAKAYLDKKKDRLVNGSSLDLSSIGKGLKGLFGKK